MTVVMLINGLTCGGAEKQLLLVAAGLCRLGFNCALYWLEDQKRHPRISELMDSALDAGVSFYPPSANSRVDVRQLLRIRRRLRSDPNAILWTWGHRSDVVGLLLRIGLRRIRQIGSMRSAHSHRIRRYRYFWWLLGRTHVGFISNSRLNVQQVANVASTAGKNSVVIYNAVEARCFEVNPTPAFRPKTLRVVMLGRQKIFTKGYDIAIELSKIIQARKLPITISVGGGLSDEEPLQDMIVRHDVGNVIQAIGEVSDPLAFLSQGHVFLMLSRHEGTPNALLEAMALGLPAVCTRVGDVEAFASDGINIRLIDPDAEHALTALLAIWNDWTGAIEMGNAARDVCREKFSEASMINATAAVLQRLENTGKLREQDRNPDE
jgi:glycosyltransferase involved in cell wall biosynthesis